jgi:hypothetical protein
VKCEDLRRSEEILTGALPSERRDYCCGDHLARDTWRTSLGHREKALELPEEQKQPDDWVVFFQWQDDPAYCDAEPRPLTQETRAYFADKTGFSAGQMSWYQRAREQYG